MRYSWQICRKNRNIGWVKVLSTGDPVLGTFRLLDYELVENWFQEVTRSNTERINRFCMAFPAGDVETQRGNRRGLQ